MAIQKVRAAIVGCGVISDIYFENMRSIFSVLDLACCCDTNPAAARRTSEKFNIPARSMEEILADASIELLVNLTPPAAHYPIVKQALLAGKHVYTEKPLADSLEKAEELVALANSQNRMLGAAPDTFLGAAAQTARYVADSGLVGAITSCVATLNRDGGWMAEKYPYTALPGGGIGTDVGIYYVTVLLNILGPVREACGFAGTLRPTRRHYQMTRADFGEEFTITSENLLGGSFVFESGVLGSIHLNANCTQNEQPSVVLYGTEGLLYLPDPNQFGGQVRVLLKGQTEPFIMPHTHGYAGNSRGLGAADLAWALRNKRAPRAGKELALHGLELLLGLMESGRSHSFYQMKSSFERPAALPRGYLDPGYSNMTPETGLAL